MSKTNFKKGNLQQESYSELTRYKFEDNDLIKVIEFVKNYHLEPTKGTRGRTNQGKRSFGGELDEWIPGKLVEIGVCRILEKLTEYKILQPDFQIYTNKEVGEKSDPDITKVVDGKSLPRRPSTFVEIKRHDHDAKWLGPRQHQLKDHVDGFMIHASIEFNDDREKKQHDITGAVLKKITNPNYVDLSDFSDFENLVCTIDYAYSFNDLREKGHFFESGNIIPETSFPVSRPAYKKDGSLSTVYKNQKSHNGFSEQKMFWENKNKVLSFSDWELDGQYEIIEDKLNKKYIHAIAGASMFSKIFGRFLLDDNKTYKFFYKNKLGKQGGKDVFKSIDDFWFSKKRLDELLKNNEINSTKTTLKYIAKKL